MTIVSMDSSAYRDAVRVTSAPLWNSVSKPAKQIVIVALSLAVHSDIARAALAFALKA